MEVGVVHFVGPIKPEWQDELASRGLGLLRYVPQNGFVVRGRPSDLQGASSLPYVDWVGPYKPTWKVRPGTATDGLVNVRIVVLPGESPESVEAWLGHAGVRTASASQSEPAVLGAFGTGDFRWVAARIPAGLVSSLAAQPAVEFIAPVQPVPPPNPETGRASRRRWQGTTTGSAHHRTTGTRWARKSTSKTSGASKASRSVRLGRDSSTFRRTTTISSVRPGSSITIRSHRCGSIATAGVRTRMSTTSRRAWSMRSYGPNLT